MLWKYDAIAAVCVVTTKIQPAMMLSGLVTRNLYGRVATVESNGSLKQVKSVFSTTETAHYFSR